MNSYQDAGTGDAELTVEEKRAFVAAAKQRRDAREEQRKLDAKYEHDKLSERFESELGGPEGQQFAILDMTSVGEGMFVVKLGPSILWKTYWDSKMTDVDKCDLVAACIVHPSKEQYLAARGRRQGIDAVLTNMLGKLNGLKLDYEEGK